MNHTKHALQQRTSAPASAQVYTLHHPLIRRIHIINCMNKQLAADVESDTTAMHDKLLSDADECEGSALHIGDVVWVAVDDNDHWLAAISDPQFLVWQCQRSAIAAAATHVHVEFFDGHGSSSGQKLVPYSDAQAYDSEIAYELYAPYDTTKALKKLKAEVKCFLETLIVCSCVCCYIAVAQSEDERLQLLRSRASTEREMYGQALDGLFERVCKQWTYVKSLPQSRAAHNSAAVPEPLALHSSAVLGTLGVWRSTEDMAQRQCVLTQLYTCLLQQNGSQSGSSSTSRRLSAVPQHVLSVLAQCWECCLYCTSSNMAVYSDTSTLCRRALWLVDDYSTVLAIRLPDCVLGKRRRTAAAATTATASESVDETEYTLEGSVHVGQLVRCELKDDTGTTTLHNSYIKWWAPADTSTNSGSDNDNEDDSSSSSEGLCYNALWRTAGFEGAPDGIDLEADHLQQALKRYQIWRALDARQRAAPSTVASTTTSAATTANDDSTLYTTVAAAAATRFYEQKRCLSTEATAVAAAVIGARHCASAAMPKRPRNGHLVVEEELLCNSTGHDNDNFSLVSFDMGTSDRYDLLVLGEDLMGKLCVYAYTLH
eukprot:4045-Heterococcus_DN1.PRE.4